MSKKNVTTTSIVFYRNLCDKNKQKGLITQLHNIMVKNHKDNSERQRLEWI